MVHYPDTPSTAVEPSQRKRKPELADILDRYLPSFLKRHKISAFQAKVLNAIRRCRTAFFGGHIRECDNEECGHTEIAYNSCRNRHCPKCGGSKRFQWLKARLDELLPIPYYHVVFTMPHELNDLCLCNKEVIYTIFFKAAAQTLQTFAADKKYLGGKIGFISILHTWGRKLCYHVHLHIIVTGGGLRLDGKGWKALPYRKQFLFPSKAMSKVIAGIFIKALKKAYHQGDLNFPGDLQSMASENDFEQFLNMLAGKAWFNYVKAPFSSAEKVVAYTGDYSNREAVRNAQILGIEPAAGEDHSEDNNNSGYEDSVEDVLEYGSRYSNQVGISNAQILDIENDQVHFEYKDYKDGHKKKVMILSALEFIRRFLLHILPCGVHKIRYYGILANNCREECLAKAREFLAANVEALKEKTESILQKFANHLCPQCGKGEMRYKEYISPSDIVMIFDSS